MPSEADRRVTIEAFRSVRWPQGRESLADAWAAIYQMLFYYEEGVNLLHIIEANELRTNKQWQARAVRAESYLAQYLGLSNLELRIYIDVMMQLPRWTSSDPGRPTQRHNPVGNGFRTLAAHIFSQFGPSQLTYVQEAPATQWFPGIQLPGRSDNPFMDVLIAKGNAPRAVVSCKWGTRHDRSSDPSNECPVYKAAASYRGNIFGYYVLTSEFNLARLGKLLNQYCIDGVIIPNTGLLEEIHRDQPAKAQAVTAHPKLVELKDFVQTMNGW